MSIELSSLLIEGLLVVIDLLLEFLNLSVSLLNGIYKVICLSLPLSSSIVKFGLVVSDRSIEFSLKLDSPSLALVDLFIEVLVN
jgi:hypothetical protein